MSNNPNQSLTHLLSRPIGRLLWHYSLPAVVGMLVMSGYNVIDRIFIGRGVGSDAIAGLTITFPVMNLSAALGVLVGAGASTRVSILLGAGNIHKARQVLGNTLVMILIVASIYITAFAIFLDPILRAFGASDATLPYARSFMQVILPGMLVMNIMFSFNNIMRASGYPIRAMVTMLIGAGANVVLAPIFIFALDWGIAGAAFATDIAMLISAIFVMAHFVNPRSNLHFVDGTYRLRWPIVWSIISIGAAPSLVNAASSAINAIINTTLSQYGDDAIAAAGIFSTYTSLLCMLIVGMCQGMQPIIGYNYGAGRPDRSLATFWLAVAVGTAVSAFGCAFGLIYPDYIAMAFTVDPTLIAVTTNALRISLIMFWVVGFQIVATNFFMSIGNAGKSIFLSLTRQVLFLIPFLLILPHYMRLDGVWASFPASDILATVVTAAMILWQIRHIYRNKTAPLQ